MMAAASQLTDDLEGLSANLNGKPISLARHCSLKPVQKWILGASCFWVSELLACFMGQLLVSDGTLKADVSKGHTCE